MVKWVKKVKRSQDIVMGDTMKVAGRVAVVVHADCEYPEVRLIMSHTDKLRMTSVIYLTFMYDMEITTLL